MGKFVDYTGHRFGKLLVLGRVEDYVSYNKTNGRRSVHARWEVRCDCTYEYRINSTSLLKRSKQCKQCAYRARPQSTLKLSGIQRMFNMRVASSLKSRKLDCSIDAEFYESFIGAPCYYCHEPAPESCYDKPLVYAKERKLNLHGIDRVDPKRGYHADNCVPCCWKCNRLKSDMTLEEFLKKIKQLHDIWWTNESDTQGRNNTGCRGRQIGD